jgi:hypothetical protein
MIFDAIVCSTSDDLSKSGPFAAHNLMTYEQFPFFFFIPLILADGRI